MDAARIGALVGVDVLSFLFVVSLSACAPEDRSVEDTAGAEADEKWVNYINYMRMLAACCDAYVAHGGDRDACAEYGPDICSVY